MSVPPTTDNPDLPTAEQLQDPIWRVCNLYSIVDKAGNVIPFRPNPAQLRLLNELSLRTLLVKARQLGYSTLFQIIMLDQCIFVPNTHAAVIAQDRDAARKIFDDKIKLAWLHMPAWVHHRLKTTGDNVNELVFANGSSIRVATSTRSATLQYLHVSEFGKISAMYPARAREVMTGSIPAVGPDGFVFIESTAEGKSGKFWELVDGCQKRQRSGIKRTKLDFKLHFVPWFANAEYATANGDTPTEIEDAYFDEIEEQAGTVLTGQQRSWYITTCRTVFACDTQMMRQEYPSIIDEAFEVSTEGCWFTTQMQNLRKANGITSVPYQPGVPVDTAWDIGRKDGTAIWFFQRIGHRFHIIDHYEEWDKDYDHYVKAVLDKPYVYGRHFLPHDAEHVRQADTAANAKSAEQILQGLGLRTTVIVPRTPTKITAIRTARSTLPMCVFDRDRCAAGITHLEMYHKVWSAASAAWTDEPAHDIHSESADAFMQLATGWVPATAAIPSSRFLKHNVQSTNPFARR